QVAYKAKDAVVVGDFEKAIEILQEFVEGVKESLIKESVLEWVNEYKKRIL
ncbi:MAG: hypothetical protein GX285_00040, partial [Clostridiales bacterium]|nr:hypothetical protein [Clostridiales bacterium]